MGTISAWGTERGPDGPATDAQGWIFAPAGFKFPSPAAETARKYRAGVYVFSPDGALPDMIPVPADMITKCTLGGADLKTLFVTAGHRLWSIPVRAPVKSARPKADCVPSFRGTHTSNGTGREVSAAAGKQGTPPDPGSG